MKRRNYIIISAVLVSILASMIFTKEISALTVNEKTLIGKPTLLYTKRYFQRFDHIKLQDDYIYYTNTDKQLIRTNLDGTDKKIIVAHEISSYTMDQHYLYYGDYNRRIFRSNLDGTGEIYLTQGESPKTTTEIDYILYVGGKRTNRATIMKKQVKEIIPKENTHMELASGLIQEIEEKYKKKYADSSNYRIILSSNGGSPIAENDPNGLDLRKNEEIRELLLDSMNKDEEDARAEDEIIRGIAGEFFANSEYSYNIHWGIEGNDLFLTYDTMGFGGGKLDGVYKIDENFNAIEFSPLKRNYSFVGKTASKKFYKKSYKTWYGALYMSNLDGTDERKISNGNVVDAIFKNNKVYYIESSRGIYEEDKNVDKSLRDETSVFGGIYSINTDGSGKKAIYYPHKSSNSSALIQEAMDVEKDGNMALIDDYIYFIGIRAKYNKDYDKNKDMEWFKYDYVKALYRIKIDGSGLELIVEAKDYTELRILNYNEDYIYISNSARDVKQTLQYEIETYMFKVSNASNTLRTFKGN